MKRSYPNLSRLALALAVANPTAWLRSNPEPSEQ